MILPDQMDIPYHRTSHPVYKVGVSRGKKEEGETFGVTLFVFPSNYYV